MTPRNYGQFAVGIWFRFRFGVMDIENSNNQEIPASSRLVTYFLEKKGWTVEQLLETKLTFEEAAKLMKASA